MASEDTKSKATDLAARVEEPVHEAHQLLQGQMPNNPDKALGHPIHPATVHWPIAVGPMFLCLSIIHPLGLLLSIY